MLAALGNHLWQSTFFAVAAALLTRLFRHHRARVRHAIWLAALCKFAIPFTWLLALGAELGSHIAFPGLRPSVAAPEWSTLLDGVVQPLTVRAASAAVPASTAARHFNIVSIALPLWGCGAAVVLGIATLRWRRIQQALRSAQPCTEELNSECPIPLKLSRTRIEPTVIGIFRPVLLLPQGITERLTPEQLHAVVAHELCHVRRGDNLTGALQLLIQAVFWFYLPVWWIGARVLEERERACDEAVLESGRDPDAYAESLLNVCALYLTSSLDCAAGVTGAALKRRIEAIVQHRIGRPLRLATRALLMVGGLLAASGPIAIGVLRTPMARAQTTSRTPDSSELASLSIWEGFPDTPQKTLLTSPSGRITARDLPLKSLVGYAYTVQDAEIVGPDDALSRLYSLDAQTRVPLAPDPSQEALRSTVQGLLADQFKLASHWETRRAPTYTLLSGDLSGLHPTAPGNPGPAVETPMGSLTGHAVPFSNVVKILSLRSDRPIVDRTGLTGRYNFTLTWEPPPAKVDPTYLTQTAAKELGIRIVPQDGDVRYLVIDRIERPAHVAPAPTAVTLAPTVFDRYVGRYLFPGNVVMAVSRDGDRYFTQITSQAPVPIFASSEREFFAKSVDARITFETREDGEATALVLHQNELDRRATRMSAAQAQAQTDSLARRLREHQPAPGSEAMLRRHIGAWQHSEEPQYQDSDPAIAEAVRTRWSLVHKQFANLGEPQSIAFIRISPFGGDVYEVRFQTIRFEVQIHLNSVGKIDSLSFRQLLSPTEIASHTRHYDITAGDIRERLNEFSRQANVQLLFDFPRLKGLATSGLRGDYDFNEALRVLLNGLPLTYRWVDGGTVAVARTDGTAPQPGVPTAAGTLPSPSQTNESVLRFDGETLATVVDTFNRYNHRKLVIDDARIADVRIGGIFPKADPDNFVSALSAFGIQARIQGAEVDPGSGTIHLSRASR